MNYITKFAIAIFLLIAVSCMSGCFREHYRSYPYSCSQYAYNVHSHHGFISHEEAKIECMASDVYGPYAYDNAIVVQNNLNIRGMCQEPGSYVTREYLTNGNMHYLVMCPTGYTQGYSDSYPKTSYPYRFWTEKYFYENY